MRIIFLGVQDYVDNYDEINEQLIAEGFGKGDKVVLCYSSKYVWEMGIK